MRLTRIVHKTTTAIFVISIVISMFIPDDWGIITLINYYILWFSFGVTIGVFLTYYAMRSDIDNAQKQFENERKER